MERERLQKYLSECGLMSRRAAEKEIAAGRVRVNGEIAAIGQTVDPGEDRVTWHGQAVVRQKQHHTYLMLNKPVGYVTTLSDEQGRPCVADLLTDVKSRVYPVGRLDMYSEGLLLLTDDGELANRLTHPRHEIPKIYLVKVNEAVSAEKVKALGRPMELDGYTIEPVKTEIVSRRDGETVLKMTLYEGRNRQIRRMCETQDLKIVSLRRVAIGPITLGNLKPGAWRRLTEAQVNELKK